MSEITENRQNLYNNLIDDGYFRGEDGEINFSFEDFCSSLDDKENVETFYANLIDDGYFRDEDGELYLNLDEFIAMVGNTQEKLEYYPITENQRGIYIDWDMNRSSIQYNIIGVETFPGVSADTLAEALRTVVDAHPYLKVHLELKDGDVVQVRRDEDPVVVTVSHLEAKPDKDFFQQRVRPFNVLENDLYRLEVYEYGGETWLFKDMHHLIYDGGSDLFFMQDLNRVLAGDAIEQETYTAYDNALREAKQMLSLQYEEAEAYFDNLINGTNSTVYPHSDIRESDENLSNSISVIIEKSDIEKICLEEGLTGHSFFLAVTEQALHNMTSEKDVQLMTIHNGRTDMRMMGIMGMFVKTVPVVSHLATHGETMIDAAKEVQKQFLKIQSYDFYPYTHVVERHGLSAQIMYDYIEAKTVDRPEAEEGLSSSTAKYPLDINVIEYANCYEVIVGYDMSLYCADDMHLLGDAIKNIATAVAKNSKAPIATLPVMDDEKVKVTLEASSGETIDFEYSETFVKEFKRQVTKTPDNIAVVDASEAISYSELDTKSDALAAVLLSKGVAKDSFVAVVLNRTIEFPLSVLGIHKAGAAYMPIDIAYPSERINYMLTDSESKVVITTRPVAESLKSEKGISFDGQEVLFLDEICLDEHASAIDLSTDDGVAYMIYTSGSTGVPKGAMLHQRGLRNFAASIIRAEELTENDIIASHRSFSFDAHIGDIFPILSVGGQLHIMPSEIRQDLDAIYNYIVDHKITGTGGTTSLMSMLINNYDLPLRFITAGGEKLFGVYSEKMKIINLYGPTECTNDSALYVIEPGQQIENIPIGRPLPNTQSLILSPYGQLLPTGVAGELCITGAQVGYGYWKKPEITQAAFANNHFGEGKLYHSGDMAKYNAEGQIMYVGRIDSQVKLRGYRIDMGEIEANVSTYEGIHQCVASVAEANGNKHLVCFYVVEEGATVDKTKLAEYIEGTTLPKYMYPEMYVELEALPTLPNGKINRKQLPKIEMSADDVTMPATDTEKALHDIVIELFKLESIGVNVNLLSVGMTSLTAMRFGAMTKNKLGKALPTKSIMQYKTIRNIAAFLDEESASQPQESHKVWEKRNLYPITQNQLGIYIDWEMNRDALQYNLPSVLPMEDMEAEKLCDALERVIEAHPYLKTTFVISNGDVMLKRNDELPACVDLIVLDHEPEDGFFQSRVRPFDLLKDRLYRFEVYKTPSSLYLFQDIHHIIFDGGSNLILLDEVIKAYKGIELERAAYTAFENSLDEKVLLESEAYSEAETYFDKLLENAETASLHHVGLLNENRDVKANAYVDVDLKGEAITSYCRKHDLTVNNFFLTVIMQVLHRLINDEKIAITTICNGRENNDLLRSIGMFVKTLPVVSTKLPANSKSAFAEIAQQMQQQSFDSQSRSFYPFTTVVERNGIRPNIMFIYQGGVDISAETIEVAKQTVDLNVDLDTVKVPIAIMIGDAAEGNFHMNIEYATARFGNDEMIILANAIQNFIENVLNSPETSVTEIPIVSAAEAKDIIESSFGGDFEYNKNETFVDMVVNHAAKRPEAIAVVDGEGSISYGELDRWSDIVASTLIAKGVVRNEFVCVKLPRCKEFLVAVLGVMKAGAAYVPVDKDYPQERIEFMQIDSEAKVMIDEVFMSGINQAKPCASVNLSSTAGLAYMIYTSGSTGKPKGVMQSHRSLRAFCAWRIDQLNITSESKNAQHASFSFDASLDDLLCPLAAGGEVHILSDKLRLDMEGMRNYFKANGITGLTMSTQMGMAMLNAYNDLPLNYLMMGGEKLLPFQKTPIKVINGYGPTEFTVCSSFHVVNQDTDIDIPIGRAVPNTWSLVCDSYGNLLPWGISGELCLSGPQIAEGYWHRKDLTAEKFVPMPFCQNNQMYRTGDMVRYNANGELEFMGRIDNMVKLRGFRIELGEIETRASQYEVMKDVAAEVKTVGTIQHLVLYFSASAQVDTNKLREFMAETLTEYMVPTIFMQLEALPLTPNGKINRKALPEPSLSDSVENVAPANEKEGTLLKLAYELLGHEGFGVTDNLMLQGFTSLMGIKLVAMASMQKIVIKLDDLMKQKTIRGVLEHNMTMGFWANMPSPEKPIVVVTCGETPYKNMLPYINALSKQYSVFIIECILEHYDYLFVDANIDEVLEMYYTLLDLNIGLDSDIKVFTGHCFGGEIAYRLANRWKNEHPSSAPKVVMLDVFWRLSTEQSNEEDRQLLDLLPQDFLDSHQEEIAHFNKVHDMYNALNTNDSPAIFDGKLVLFRAMRSEPDSEAFSMLPPDLVKQINQHRNTGRKVDNEAFWRSLYPELECVHVEADHMGMLEESQIGTYVEWINKNI